MLLIEVAIEITLMYTVVVDVSALVVAAATH